MSVLISFDLDNTLWDVDPTLERAEYAMFHWFDDRFPGFNEQFDAETLFALKRKLLEEFETLKCNVTQVRIETYRIALEQFGLPKEEAKMVAQSAFDFFHDWRQKVDLYPGAEKVLWQLANRYRMAVITNGNADVYHPQISLGSSFDYVIRADQHGVAKPDIGIFQKAADLAKVDVSNIIHIGDNPHDDVYGVNSAGGRSIWFNRHGARRWLNEWGTMPNAEVHSLDELPEMIEKMVK